MQLVLTRLGRSADCSKMPAYFEDKVCLGVVIGAVGNEELKKIRVYWVERRKSWSLMG
jgi:hypothetical protein